MNRTKKILILSANPKDSARLRLDEEVREIEEGFQRSKYRELFTIQSKWAISIRDLRRTMLDYKPNIVHFCGHGEEEGLMVEDMQGHAVIVPPDALADLFEHFADHLECVLLNACYSQTQAEALGRYIPYVIGMKRGIQDEAAIEFAIGFYDALSSGTSYQKAFEFGCNALRLYSVPEHLMPILNEKIRNSAQIIEIIQSSNQTKPVSPTDTATKHSPILCVSSINDLSQNKNLSWLPIKVEKDFTRLFANVGIQVLFPLTFSQSSARPDYDYEIKGVIHQEDASTILSVYFTDRNEQIVSTGELKGDVDFFTRIASVISQAFIYELDIDIYTLNTKNTKRKPTLSLRAYSLYLLAKKELREGKEDTAISVLKEAIIEDPQFAMAYWTIAQIYYDRGNKQEGNVWDRKARLMDPDHPHWSYIDPRKEKHPLTELLQESNKRQFEFLDPGMSYKIIKIQAYAFEVGVWIIEPAHYDISVILQKDAKGNFIDEFIQTCHVILALNGTPFEMDKDYRLSPIGLLMNRRKIYHPVTKKGGSGIFCITDNRVDIISSNKLQDSKSYNVALQSGPILVENRGVLGIYSNNYERCNRSAIGVCGNRVALIIVAGEHGEALSLYEFAQFLRTPTSDGGIGCDVALNLDGGPSSQMYFKYKKHRYRIEGHWRINNAIVVTSRS